MVKNHSDTERGNPRLAARVLLYGPSHRQDSTCHDLCYTSRETTAVTFVPKFMLYNHQINHNGSLTDNIFKTNN